MSHNVISTVLTGIEMILFHPKIVYLFCRVKAKCRLFPAILCAFEDWAKCWDKLCCLNPNDENLVEIELLNGCCSFVENVLLV